jgi:hypothetical protein
MAEDAQEYRRFLEYILLLDTKAKTAEQSLIAYGRIREAAAMTLRRLDDDAELPKVGGSE